MGIVVVAALFVIEFGADENTRGSRIELGMFGLGHSRLTDRARDVSVQSRLTYLSSGCRKLGTDVGVANEIAS